MYTHQQDLPFLPTHNYFPLPTTAIIQYSKSTHHLLPYPKIQKHFPPSNNFHHTPHNNHPLPIYHQTYQIQPRSYQSV
ncbi:monooxygenase family protein, partial [Bacillus pumilus]|uniref:monooxygenase family protein n=1 Tax=Bacillus pumilus TaxID=1408 RepID=UPI0034D977C5